MVIVRPPATSCPYHRRRETPSRAVVDDATATIIIIIIIIARYTTTSRGPSRRSSLPLPLLQRAAYRDEPASTRPARPKFRPPIVARCRPHLPMGTRLVRRSTMIGIGRGGRLRRCCCRRRLLRKRRPTDPPHRRRRRRRRREDYSTISTTIRGMRYSCRDIP